jgi:hypothetical protein
VRVMELQVGKRYRNRSSTYVVRIIEPTNDAIYPFRADNGFIYTADGRYYHSRRPSDADLIEEATEAVPPIPVATELGGRLSELLEAAEQDSPITEQVSPGIDQIPYEGIEAIGEQFALGEPKYGRDNWKRSPEDAQYDQERTRHAMRHLWLWANGDRSENHLAKCGWFCVTQIWREKQRAK